MGDLAADAVLARQIRDWLLAFLRFAVTHDEIDRASFLARAHVMDRGGHLDTPAFGFFARVSSELCDAILTKEDPQSRARLKQLLKRVDDRQLRRTIEAVIALEPLPAKREMRSRSRDYLWQGLATSKSSSD